MKEYNYYLFDLDGTLISTIDMILECFRHSLQYAGNIKIDPEEIKSHVGLPLQKQFEIYLKDKPGIDYQKLKEYHMNYQLKIWQDHVYLYPGIRQTLEKLQQLNKTMAVVTSRKIKTTTIYTEKLGIRSFFKLLVTPENTEKHKPNPEPVLYTLSRLKADPGQS
ncbi:MAG TPA: HAD hydrolase-like protein, partial [Spirochaetota bacterium]|nr:HAD hydrolase-like protein [Spirochaetota bacterium]